MRTAHAALWAVLFALPALAQLPAGGTSTPGRRPYEHAFTATATVNIDSDDHKMGAQPLVFCYNGASPKANLAATWTASTTGDLVITLTNGSATGNCYVTDRGGYRGPTGATGAAGADGADGDVTAAGTNTMTGFTDFLGASRTAPHKAGTSLPGTCAIGETFFKTDAFAGRNIYSCTDVDTWTLQGGAAAVGSAGAVQVATEDGGLGDGGITASAGDLNVPGELTTGDGTVTSCITLRELAANGNNFRKVCAADLITTDITFTYPNTSPAGTVMKWGTPSSGVSTGTDIVALEDSGTNGILKRVAAGDTDPAVAGTGGDYYGPAAAPVPIHCTFDGGGSTVAQDTKCYKRVPYACAIAGWSIEAQGSSPTTTIDVLKVATGTALPTSSIAASAKPALATGNALASTTLTGWTTSVAANDIVGFNVDAVANATWIMITLRCQ